jgi:hypothetical protein
MRRDWCKGSYTNDTIRKDVRNNGLCLKPQTNHLCTRCGDRKCSEGDGKYSVDYAKKQKKRSDRGNMAAEIADF